MRYASKFINFSVSDIKDINRKIFYIYHFYLSLFCLEFFTKQEKDAHLYGVDVTYSVSLEP